MSVDLDALLGLATSLAEEAADLAVSMREGIEVDETKSSPTDVVTAADKAVEKLLAEGIRAARPDDGLLGEEGSETTGTTGVRWVIDPIDGTVNYLYGIPQWAVSIGIEVDGVRSVGVVLDPSEGAPFRAVRGGGAWLGDRRLSVTPCPSLAEALVGTGFGYDARRRAAQSLLLPLLLPRVRDIRRAGAGALDLCAVAAGRLDGYYEQGLSPWDLCAGGLIVEEAGGVVSGLRGREAGFDLVLASGPALHPLLHDLLTQLDADAAPF